MRIPVPRLHPDTRHAKRMAQRNPRHLYHRQCMCNRVGHDHRAVALAKAGGRCPTEFETTYSPERPELVYCEQCYQEEVV